MGDYTTQERETGAAPAYKVRRNNRDPFNPASIVSLTPRQTTYSYRSSAPDPTPPADLKSELDLYDWLKQTTEDKPKSDTGHEFFTTSTNLRCSHSDVRLRSVGLATQGEFEGALVPALGSSRRIPAFPSLTRLTDAEVKDYGTRAIKATTPTKPGASLATTMSELAVLLPTLPGAIFDKPLQFRPRSGGRKERTETSTRDKASRLSQEYLNWVFAISPTIADTKAAAKSLLNASTRLAQLHRDSEKVVRRNFRFPDEVKTSYKDEMTTINFWGIPTTSVGWLSFNEGQQARLQTTTTSTVETWFSGAYSFWYGVDESTLGRLKGFERDASTLLGTRITAETLWELTPWSWLSDWYGTIGNSIANAERFQNDSLVLRYGYLMRKRTDVVTYTVTGLKFRQGNTDPGPISVTLTRVTKERKRASPYGFAMKDTDLSASQWSILAALGMTKGPRARY